jgi:methylated-DNA-protein-cysteine methyltransferase-like protein
VRPSARGGAAARRAGAKGAATAGSFAAIWNVAARIPRGRVATYKQIALIAGLPRSARIAGWAMRLLPDGLRVDGRRVPWHRVVGAGGFLRCPRGTDAGDLQAALLRREGIEVIGHRVAAFESWRWSPRRRPARAT